MFSSPEYSELLCDTGMYNIYNMHVMHECISMSRFVNKLSLVHRNELIEIFKCHCIKVALPEINQFCDGLQALGVLDYIKQYPDIMRFVDDGKHLTASKLKLFSYYIFSQYFICKTTFETSSRLSIVVLSASVELVKKPRTSFS